jgi:HrpA-like RNA helicase
MVHEACNEINHALRLKNEKSLCEPSMDMPLYYDLPLEMHDKVFQPTPKHWRVGILVRNIIVSTHIA